MEPKIRISITDINADGSLSVLTQTYVEFDGQEITVSNHREALTPGQFDRAHEILPDNLYNAIAALWTTDVVEGWEEKQKQLEMQIGIEA